MVLSAAEQIKEALASLSHRQGSTRPQIKAAIQRKYGRQPSAKAFTAALKKDWFLSTAGGKIKLAPAAAQ